ncbi:MAG: DUF4169 family protein [Hyphomicrobiales bacterium]|nr:DUF4169 family protein [Hyphomicrobiales bacterium]
MGEIVNLRRARKDRVRREAENAATTNRVAFGRTRAEKDGQKALRAFDERKLDAHRREPGAGDD